MKANIPDIIPKPQNIKTFNGSFTLSSDTVLYFDQQFEYSVNFFVESVKQMFGIEVKTAEDMTQAHICFDAFETPNSYSIECNDGHISICAYDDVFCFYAIQTLLQMFAVDQDNNIVCKNCILFDSPQFGFRGLHIDIARHFFGLQTLKQIVDLMASVKLNKLHLHFTDDQGFAIEIEKFPKINQISSRRDGSEVVANGKRFVDDTPHEGYLKKSEVRELVEYAKQRCIDIIPEFDIPGHSVALLSAYPEFSCVGHSIEVRKKWGISKDLLCAGNEQMYSFVSAILDEIVELFPCEYFHLGGDEAPKDRWCNCPKCREMLRTLNLKNYGDLQSYVMNFFALYLSSKGKKVVCWNDGITNFSNPEIICHYWKPATRAQVVRCVNNGRDAIMSPFFHVYFDYPYAMTPLKKTYKFKPIVFGIKKRNAERVLGVEGAVWTEHIFSEEKLFFNLMPRLLALSESAWGTNNNFGDFKRRAKLFCKNHRGKKFVYNANSFQFEFLRFRTIKDFFMKDSQVELKKKNAVAHSGKDE